MKYGEWERWSPNFSSEPEHERRGVLVHHTVLALEPTLARMADRASEVSYHGLIARDGARHLLVRDSDLAWHAGVSSFRGRTGCNRFLLGLAFVGDTYRMPLSDAQLDSALEWIAPRWSRYGWSADCFADHRQVSPGRKDDLNPVEWDRFFAALRDAAATGRLGL